MRLVTLFACIVPLAAAADLTGNWAVLEPRADGTVRRTYLNLKQNGARVSGTVYEHVFFYDDASGTYSPDGFVLSGSAPEGRQRHKASFKITPDGENLRIEMPDGDGPPARTVIAKRVAAGVGALPPRMPLPPLHRVAGNGLAKTPPMGWNSWNKFEDKVDDAMIRATADAMVANGMKAAGYEYVNIDDTWQGVRDASGNIHANNKFPDMKALADYVHSKGLKLGLYSSPGPDTCAGYEGSYGHEEQDAKTYATWGIDYLKYDWCGARNIYGERDMQPLYQRMGDALLASGRRIVYSLCQYGQMEVWKWGPDVGGNLWRTTGDISDRWNSMSRIGFGQSERAPFAGPGHWNDPDMLEVGNGGMSETEYRAHMSLWALLAAPLLAGNDLRNMTPAIAGILMNREVIAIDQDKLGKQGSRLSKSGDKEIWQRQLADGLWAIGLFNLGESETAVSFAWSDVAVRKKPKSVRDVWAHSDLKPEGATGFHATVPGHGVVLLKVRGSR